MGLKIEEVICEECGQEYEVKHYGVEPLVNCVFCGSETMQIDEQDDDFKRWYEDDEILDED